MNGVQGVASSNLVIPTRISGSCDGESRLPFLLNSSRAGFSSRRAVFSRAAGDSQRHLVPCSRGRILPCLSFSALSCSESVAATGKGGEGGGKCLGLFHDARNDSAARRAAAPKGRSTERRGFRQSGVGVAGHAVPTGET